MTRKQFIHGALLLKQKALKQLRNEESEDEIVVKYYDGKMKRVWDAIHYTHQKQLESPHKDDEI